MKPNPKEPDIDQDEIDKFFEDYDQWEERDQVEQEERRDLWRSDDTAL